MILRYLLPLLLLFASTATAQMIGAGPVDPFWLTPIPYPNNPNLSVSGLSQTTSQSLNLSQTNLIIVQAGQSNNMDTAPDAYTPTNASHIFNLNIYDGKIYPAIDPLVGCGYIISGVNENGNPALRVADALISASLFQNVYIVPLAIGGTSAADWESGLESTRLSVAALRLAQRGMVAQTNVTVIVMWGQGEEDNLLGTSQATYTTEMNAVIAQFGGGTWFIAEQTYDTGNGGTTSPAVQAAQAALVNHPSVWAGPDADALVGNICGPSANAACRQSDGTHWSDNGSYSYAAAWVTALEAYGSPF